jgi:hypothetical protein
VVLDHVFGERDHLFVLRHLDRLLGGLDVDLSGGVRDMRNLRIGWLGAALSGCGYE